MSGKLKGLLEADPDLKVEVALHPVDSTNAPKVYKIALDDEAWFDFEVDPTKGPPVVAVKPNDKWSTPVNFETHEKFFGPHKPWQVEELKEAIKAKM
mmetsp:Transcript_1950/g.4952  ORF Transcript_1950/g.4952 Transcript_1950/m.4952 type:complete len:97 (-) Transcript_1950:298-588(-)|eukprot:CAMPEP_0197414652 /NCGR_PEP_ID=MMETSP1170-20131217/1344_1 /TAXON_ID=54406 /ORGANISM="Sarcinochrysis sp, Strain CCMP770" /LENGTH=96 /DNA_ID=CAMNT_0042941381 /DNA_START=112 /DNA_END=402 /DNA_ORIENTATION=+